MQRMCVKCYTITVVVEDSEEDRQRIRFSLKHNYEVKLDLKEECVLDLLGAR